MARALVLGALAVVTSAAAAPAQQGSSVPAQQVDDRSGVVPSADGRLRFEIGVLQLLMRDLRVPDASVFRFGNQTVPPDSTVRGTVAVARGNLDVRGQVTGDVVVLHGDIIVHPGASIQGSTVAVDGRVRMTGGMVGGDVRSIRGVTGSLLARTGREPAVEPLSTWAAIKMVIGWFAVLLAIGIGVLLFAERNLAGVVAVLDRSFSQAFWVGLLAQFAALPALLLVCVGLAISILGILLIPFAIVAFVIALAGLVTLGFIAIARFTGRAFFGAAGESRMVALRSLALGLTIYLGLWLLAAAFVWNPVAGSVLRSVALAGSWVAATFGLGATILSRAGTQRDGTRKIARPLDELSWQTPTPVTGVAAARRPVAVVKER